MVNFPIIDAHLHCGIQNVNWAWERIKPLHQAAGITGLGLIPPVEDVYDRYDPSFTDSAAWQAWRAMLWSKFAPVKRGWLRRKSSSGISSTR